MHSTPLDGMMTFGAGTRLILEYLKVDHITAPKIWNLPRASL